MKNPIYINSCIFTLYNIKYLWNLKDILLYPKLLNFSLSHNFKLPATSANISLVYSNHQADFLLPADSFFHIRCIQYTLAYFLCIISNNHFICHTLSSYLQQNHLLLNILHSLTDLLTLLICQELPFPK